MKHISIFGINLCWPIFLGWIFIISVLSLLLLGVKFAKSSQISSKDKVHLDALLNFGGEGHGDADVYMRSIEYFVAYGEDAVPVLSKKWKHGRSYKYIIAYLLNNTSYRSNLLVDITKMLQSRRADDKQFAAYVIGMLYNNDSMELTKEVKMSVINILEGNVKLGVYNNVGADFPKALRHFSGGKPENANQNR